MMVLQKQRELPTPEKHKDEEKTIPNHDLIIEDHREEVMLSEDEEVMLSEDEEVMLSEDEEVMLSEDEEEVMVKEEPLEDKSRTILDQLLLEEKEEREQREKEERENQRLILQTIPKDTLVEDKEEFPKYPLLILFLVFILALL